MTSAAIVIAIVMLSLSKHEARAQTAPPTGTQILARAKAAFRAPLRPPYISYTLERRDLIGLAPDLLNSYDLRIWCRTSDRKALARRAFAGQTIGELQSLTVGFDGVVDPGPPNANIFERNLFTQAGQLPAEPDPYDTPAPANVIGSVRVQSEYEYRVVTVQREGSLWDLTLAPLRDPQRNRIDELWVRADTYVVQRARVRDHLFLSGVDAAGNPQGALPAEYDLTFTQRDGIPLITTINGRTDDGRYEIDYTYTHVAFPGTLPDWYFDPATYPDHRLDGPQ